MVKHNFIEKTAGHVQMACKMMSNTKDTHGALHSQLNISQVELIVILEKIANSLEPYYYHENFAEIREEASQIIASEFMLFQVQESLDDDEYDIMLLNFIEEINDILDEKYLVLDEG